MDMVYFYEHIHEELEDAVHYAEKAIAMRRDKPKWAKTFMELSNNEVKHATMLFDMFEGNCEVMPEEEDETTITSIGTKAPSRMDRDTICKKVTDDFASSMTKLRNLKDIFYGRI